MATITVYRQKDDDRKRGQVLLPFALCAIAVVAIGGRKPEPVVGPVIRAAAPSGAVAPPVVVEKIVYASRPTLLYSGPIGPQRPDTLPTRPVPQPRPHQTTPPRRAPVTNAVLPAPPPVPAVQPAVSPSTPPVAPASAPRALLIEPRGVHFVHGGTQRVSVVNPNSTSVAVYGIRMGTAGGASAAGFSLAGHERCIKTLSPGERCYFTVVATPTTNGSIGILIDREP